MSDPALIAIVSAATFFFALVMSLNLAIAIYPARREKLRRRQPGSPPAALCRGIGDLSIVRDLWNCPRP